MRAQYKNDKCYSPKVQKPLSKQNINKQRINSVQSKRQAKIPNIPMYHNSSNGIPILQNGQMNPQHLIVTSSRSNMNKNLGSYEKQLMTQQNNSPQPYEKMIAIYQKQNENLKRQNSFLIDQLRLQKRKQLNLKGKIAQLQQVIAGFSISQDNQQTGTHKFEFSDMYQEPKFPPPSPKLYRQSRLGESYQDITNTNVENLTRDFYQMITKCSRQKNSSKKKQLRKSLAHLAKQMKKIRGMQC